MALQVSTLADLRPGDIGFGPIGGAAGLGIQAAEQVAELISVPRDFKSWREWREIEHVGTVTQAASSGFELTPHGAHGVGPMFAQAEPPGYQEIELGAEHWTARWVYLRPNYSPLCVGPAAAPGVSQADTVARLAQWMCQQRIPYGWEDYAAIAGHRLGVKSARLDAFIARVGPSGLPQRAICSQGVDAQLTLSGGLVDGKVFDDGRLPQDVMPIELLIRLLRIGCEYVFRPGVS